MSPERRGTDIRTKKEMAGGALMDVGCYCINVMRLMTREEPERTTGSALWGPGGVDESFVGTLKFPSGVLGHFDCGFLTVFESGYEIRGDAGRIVVDKGFVSEPDEHKVIHVWRGDQYEAIPVPAANHYTLMIEDFADALLNNRPPRFDPQDGVENMRVIDRLYESIPAR
jgi:predicted dehydrogenase